MDFLTNDPQNCLINRPSSEAANAELTCMWAEIAIRAGISCQVKVKFIYLHKDECVYGSFLNEGFQVMYTRMHCP